MTSEQTEINALPDGRMRPDAAAHYIGMSWRTLAVWRSTGKGPAYVRVGNRIYYRQEDLDKWIRDMSVSSTTLCDMATSKPVPGGTRIIDRIYDLIIRHPDGITRSQIQTAFRGHLGGVESKESLDSLERLGLVFYEIRHGRGPLTMIYKPIQSDSEIT